MTVFKPGYYLQFRRKREENESDVHLRARMLENFPKADRIDAAPTLGLAYFFVDGLSHEDADILRNDPKAQVGTSCLVWVPVEAVFDDIPFAHTMRDKDREAVERATKATQRFVEEAAAKAKRMQENQDLDRRVRQFNAAGAARAAAAKGEAAGEAAAADLLKTLIESLTTGPQAAPTAECACISCLLRKRMEQASRPL